jgi:hypothetical protein
MHAPRPSPLALARAACIAAPMLLAACGVEEETPADDVGTADVIDATDAGADVAPDAAPDAVPDAGALDARDTTPDATPSWDDYAPPAAPVPRLTALQLENTLRDLFGDVVIPRINLPDLDEGRLTTVGAASATLSPRSVEDLERAAIEIGRQIAEPDRRESFVGCTPTGAADDACLRGFVEALGRRAWRRPLTAAEIDRVVAIGASAAEALADPWEAVAWTIPALLQSPHFLFRRELGTGDEPVRTLDAWELASRLAFFLWNTTPDDALLDAARDGLLDTDEGLRATVRAMLDDSRARAGMLAYFADLWGLDELDSLAKDPTVFPAMSADLGDLARVETELLLSDVIFDRDADFREVLLAEYSFIDRRLAALYGLPAPVADGFARAEIPSWTARRGILGHASFLALNAHPTSSSATLRGVFVREVLLCTTIAPPPADVDTSIPEPDENARTLRERIAVHLQDPSCASCHALTDPIGLAFEEFDGLGVWRDEENDAPIDPSGVFEGTNFVDAWELAELVANDPLFTRCVVQSLHRRGTGAIEGLPQRSGLQALHAAFEAGGYRLRPLVEAFVLSPAFRTVGTPAEETPE